MYHSNKLLLFYIVAQPSLVIRVVKYYTYGQLQTGNITYATWVSTLMGPEKSFRGDL
jgi:hypothetical protein